MTINTYQQLIIPILLLLSCIFVATMVKPKPKLIYDLVDETPAGILVGNLAQKLSPNSLKKFTFLVMSSKFPHLTEFFKLTSNGDLIVVRLVDHDNPSKICGPLDCCHLVVCQIKVNVIMTEQNLSQSNANHVTGLTDLSVHLEMLIRIHDENDNAPQFLVADYAKIAAYPSEDNGPSQTIKPFVVYMREEDTISTYSLPMATDADSDLNGIAKYELIKQFTNNNLNQSHLVWPRLNLTYVSNDNNPSSSSSRLTVHPSPKLKQARALDYENEQDREIHATFVAWDKGIPPLQGSIPIIVYLLDINDNAPEFVHPDTKSNPVEIPENTTLDRRTIFVANATDRDSGENARLTYSFSPLSSNLIHNKFSIDSQTGSIQLRLALDYEVYSERQFVLPVVVKDAGNPAKSTTSSVYIRVVDVNDHVPTLVVQENISISEGQVFTKPIIRFYIKDEDEISHGHVVCQYVVPTSSLYRNDSELIAGHKHLRLQPISKTVFFVFAKHPLDYESTPRASLLIECTDTAQFNSTNQIRITAAILDQNDNQPIFDHSHYEVTIFEHSKANSYVTTIRAKDMDTGEYGIVSYELDRAFTVSNEDLCLMHNTRTQPFWINSQTGVIRVQNSQILDRELSTQLYMTLRARDKGNLTSVARLKVTLKDINDQAPKLVIPNDLYVTENQHPNTIIGTLKFVDPDVGQNAEIHLIQSRMGLKNEYEKYVRMVPYENATHLNQTQLLTTNSMAGELVQMAELNVLLLTQLPMDRETMSALFLELVTYDGGRPPLSSTHTITVHVTDVNDNKPVCTFPIAETIVGFNPMIYQDSDFQTVVTQIRAHDLDQGENATLRFELDKSTNGSAFFQVNQTTGDIQTNWIPDDGDVPTPQVGTYELRVEIVDKGSPQLTSHIRFFVKISPLNPQRPRQAKARWMKPIVNTSIDWSNQRPLIFISLIILSLCVILFIVGAIIGWIKYAVKLKSKSKQTNVNHVIHSTWSAKPKFIVSQSVEQLDKKSYLSLNKNASLNFDLFQAHPNTLDRNNSNYGAWNESPFVDNSFIKPTPCVRLPKYQEMDNETMAFKMATPLLSQTYSHPHIFGSSHYFDRFGKSHEEIERSSSIYQPNSFSPSFPNEQSKQFRTIGPNYWPCSPRNDQSVNFAQTTGGGLNDRNMFSMVHNSFVAQNK